MNMNNLKQNDRIIWDSGFGYEIGYFVSPQGVLNGTCVVDLCTGKVQDKVSHNTRDVHPYTEELLTKMAKIYGYEKRFSKTF